jgi:hypothetical protein
MVMLPSNIYKYPSPQYFLLGRKTTKKKKKYYLRK